MLVTSIATIRIHRKWIYRLHNVRVEYVLYRALVTCILVHVHVVHKSNNTVMHTCTCIIATLDVYTRKLVYNLSMIFYMYHMQKLSEFQHEYAVCRELYISLTWTYLHRAFKVQFTLVLWLGVRAFAGWAWVSGVWRSLSWLEAGYALLEGGWRGNLFTTLLRDRGEGNQRTSHCSGVVSV